MGKWEVQGDEDRGMRISVTTLSHARHTQLPRESNSMGIKQDKHHTGYLTQVTRRATLNRGLRTHRTAAKTK